ncbi:MAG: type I-U CRISPR-associated RAMP protein Csb1/Cas7u [Acidimicrobiaceae bacterium]|nr:type I-U CRISPR-associated RAMP protein Csb1/Cas7u [Acidimicrobiaceae bacterium]
MSELTYEQLRDAVSGGAVALRSRTELQPAEGPGGKVFPPTYAVNASHKYAVETRHVHDPESGDREVQTVLLDSVASQANRAELALLEGWELGELQFPVPFVDFATDNGEFDDIGRITVLEAPHRLADAIFRDSMLEGSLFRLSDLGRAITDAQPHNATALFRCSPTALLFGQWDSTGPKGGLGSKFQRAYVSEIVGEDAVVGKGVASRIDPLQIEKASATVYEHQDSDQRWTLEPSEAATEKGKPKQVGKGTDLGRPSQVNHGNVTPGFDKSADGNVISGGVTIACAVQTTVVSLAALRRLKFAGHDRAAQVDARTAIAALGVAAIAYQHEMDFDLRSRCLLIPEHEPRVELVGRDGSPAEPVDVSREAAASIVADAAQAAADASIGWETGEIRLVPAPKLLELLRRSREVSAREVPGE